MTPLSGTSSSSGGRTSEIDGTTPETDEDLGPQFQRAPKGPRIVVGIPIAMLRGAGKTGVWMASETNERIREKFERNSKALTLRPGLGQGTAVTRVSLTEGLACEIEDGPWKLRTDMDSDFGGEATAPTPGVLGRAALGSCLATGYAMWAAKMNVRIDHLEIEIEADYDSRGMYGIANVTPGVLGWRYTVRVQSDAPKEDVLRMLDSADAHSPELSIRLSQQSLERTVEFVTERATKAS